jgi:hypothetical protein
MDIFAVRHLRCRRGISIDAALGNTDVSRGGATSPTAFFDPDDQAGYVEQQPLDQVRQ